MKDQTSKKLFAVAGTLLTWGAVVLQLYLTLNKTQGSLIETLVFFFSFFTILTNILVALSFTAAIQGRAAFFTRPRTLTAIAVYIAIVGITYNVLLRGLVYLQGIDRVADEALHVVVPIVFVIYWFAFVPKEKLQWRCSLSWLWYPGIYLIYILIRGYFTGLYPYPFVNAATLGYSRALVNSAMVCAAFVIVALLFIAISRSISTKNKV